jgi:hypothetical protein
MARHLEWSWMSGFADATGLLKVGGEVGAGVRALARRWHEQPPATPATDALAVHREANRPHDSSPPAGSSRSVASALRRAADANLPDRA